MAHAKSLFERFPHVVETELTRLGVNANIARYEAELLAGAPVAANTDRSLLGSLNDLAYQLTVIAETERWLKHEPNYVALHSELNTIPHVKREHSFADQAVRTLFGVRKP